MCSESQKEHHYRRLLPIVQGGYTPTSIGFCPPRFPPGPSQPHLNTPIYSSRKHRYGSPMQALMRREPLWRERLCSLIPLFIARRLRGMLRR